MKYVILGILVFLLHGCSHREYVKLHKGGSGNLDIDKAKCMLEAEKSIPLENPQTVININTKKHMSKKERKALALEEKRKRDDRKWERKQRVKKLRDLCMKTKGWSWKYVEDK